MFNLQLANENLPHFLQYSGMIIWMRFISHCPPPTRHKQNDEAVHFSFDEERLTA